MHAGGGLVGVVWDGDRDGGWDAMQNSGEGPGVDVWSFSSIFDEGPWFAVFWFGLSGASGGFSGSWPSATNETIANPIDEIQLITIVDRTYHSWECRPRYDAYRDSKWPPWELELVMMRCQRYGMRHLYCMSNCEMIFYKIHRLVSLHRILVFDICTQSFSTISDAGDLWMWMWMWKPMSIRTNQNAIFSNVDSFGFASQPYKNKLGDVIYRTTK